MIFQTHPQGEKTMAKKIKMFKTMKSPADIERQINQWLDLNSNIDVLQMFQTESGSDTAGFSLTVTILFKEAEDLYKESDVHDLSQREHMRKDFRMIVDYTIKDQYYRDFIQDISESGVFIRTARSFPLGEEILLTFMSPDQQQPFKIRGKIVRALTEGIGVKFIKESSIQDSVLQSIVEMIKDT